MPTPQKISPKALIQQTADGYSIRFDRHLDHPVHTVWEAISEPEWLAKWLANVTIHPVPGGDVIIVFTNSPSTSKGKITRIEPPHLLEYTWQEGKDGVSLVCWELFPEGSDKCQLVLTHTRLANDVASFAAGWHTHLDLLTEVLTGDRTEFTWKDEWWESKLPLYGTGS
jgi:uncharacterized protein YndB with AHSA1/START domain